MKLNFCFFVYIVGNGQLSGGADLYHFNTNCLVLVDKLGPGLKFRWNCHAICELKCVHFNRKLFVSTKTSVVKIYFTQTFCIVLSVKWVHCIVLSDKDILAFFSFIQCWVNLKACIVAIDWCCLPALQVSWVHWNCGVGTWNKDTVHMCWAADNNRFSSQMLPVNLIMYVWVYDYLVGSWLPFMPSKKGNNDSPAHYLKIRKCDF